MEKNDYELFKSTYSQNKDWYKKVRSGERVSIDLIDEKYKVRVSYRPKCPGAILFRIEDYKEASGILGDKRKGPKDNDLTVLGDEIYQLEIKKIKRAKDASINQQFKDGRTWIKHILWVSNPKYRFSLSRVYNICINIRDYSNTRSRSRNNNLTICDSKPEDTYIQVIWKRAKDERLNLNNLIRRILPKNYCSLES